MAAVVLACLSSYTQKKPKFKCVYFTATNLHQALLHGLRMMQTQRAGNRVPMLFFLTDGEATSGEQDSDRIIADVSETNDAVVNIYSLAFGDGADYDLLKQVRLFVFAKSLCDPHNKLVDSGTF